MSWIVPAYHPAALLRDQTMALATIADLKKAERVSREGPTIIPSLYPPPWPSSMTHPSLEDVRFWLHRARADGFTLSLDLETTYAGEIMCCGLWQVEDALKSLGICIPFKKQGGYDYWSLLDALDVKQDLFRTLSQCRVIGQNIVGFDIPRMKAAWGIDVKAHGDTMVAHSLVMPELPHGLAFLSSIFTDLGPYKKEFGESKEASDSEDDRDKWQRVEHTPDLELREYNLLDCFATAVVWNELEKMMEPGELA